MSISFVATLGGDIGSTDASLCTSMTVASVKGSEQRSDMEMRFSERSREIEEGSYHRIPIFYFAVLTLESFTLSVSTITIRVVVGCLFSRGYPLVLAIH